MEEESAIDFHRAENAASNQSREQIVQESNEAEEVFVIGEGYNNKQRSRMKDKLHSVSVAG